MSVFNKVSFKHALFERFPFVGMRDEIPRAILARHVVVTDDRVFLERVFFTEPLDELPQRRERFFVEMPVARRVAALDRYRMAV